ncbi:MAG: TonB-dependent receptor [Pseudomonadota bacterium]|nr:TonB-dependent receptor [Pseudomonadota bacterium]
MAGGTLDTYLGLNISKTDITGVNTPAQLVGREDVLLSERERLFIEQGAPRRKGVLGFDYARDAWAGSFKIIHFGPQTLGTRSGTPVFQKYDAKTSADASVTYSFTNSTKLTVGAANLFDVTPTRQDPLETDNGHISESVQFGLNGAAYFARVHVRF